MDIFYILFTFNLYHHSTILPGTLNNAHLILSYIYLKTGFTYSEIKRSSSLQKRLGIVTDFKL